MKEQLELRNVRTDYVTIQFRVEPEPELTREFGPVALTNSK